MKLDPIYRSYHHNQMTFSMTYANSENFILVLSHDEVVHLKGSMIAKMPGEASDKFANLKVAYSFMMGHPGKKLLFMGQEFGQWHEWDESKGLDWQLLEEGNDHKDLQNFYRGLLHLYRSTPALYEDDDIWSSFQWMNCDDSSRSIFSFVRRSKDGKDNLLFICNFTPVPYKEYHVGVPCSGSYTLILDEKNGLLPSSGHTVSLLAEQIPMDGQAYSLTCPLSPYGVRIFRYQEDKASVPDTL
jgi:1,4-alpha-glucan branching enzyme